MLEVQIGFDYFACIKILYFCCMMLSQSKRSFIHSLEHKKYRLKTGCFLAEGNKCCTDLLNDLHCKLLIATDKWLLEHPKCKAEEILEIDKAELQKISLQQSPQEVLAVFEIPQYHFDNSVIAGKLSLALDNIQDPGNMGTILRLADWFGIEHVLCSKGTADAFNPKTVQATMGAIGRIKIHYLDLSEVLSQVKMPVYGTFLEGDPIYDVPLKREGIVVMGNEGNGISGEIAPYITQKLFIPDYPVGKTGSESLNVGVATAIVCSEFRRRNR